MTNKLQSHKPTLLQIKKGAMCKGQVVCAESTAYTHSITGDPTQTPEVHLPAKIYDATQTTTAADQKFPFKDAIDPPIGVFVLLFINSVMATFEILGRVRVTQRNIVTT